MLALQNTYNENWLIERHRHRPPADIKSDQYPMQLAA